MGNLVDQPPCAILQANRNGKKASKPGAFQMGADGRSNRPRDAPCLTTDSNELHLMPNHVLRGSAGFRANVSVVRQTRRVLKNENGDSHIEENWISYFGVIGGNGPSSADGRCRSGILSWRPRLLCPGSLEWLA